MLRPRPGAGVRVLTLEDIHWSDQTSQELLHYLARASERDPLLLVGIYRTDELHRRHPLAHLIAQLTRDRLFHEVRLPPLSRLELAEMLHATLAQHASPDFAAALHDRTGGNPFFVEEILKGLLEEGQLALLTQSAQQARGGKLPAIPFSVKESIRIRTADLDEATATVLNYAAVIGRHFDIEVLLRVTGLQGDLVRAIERLVDRQLVVEEQDAVEERYSFRHALSREAVCYEAVLDAAP